MVFDPTQPITDPEVFKPRGMYVDNRDPNNPDEDDADKAFVFDSSDMKALNRFLGTGRQLRTTRSDYLRYLGIADVPGEISVNLGRELDILLRTYGSIRADCVEFKNETWDRIVEIAGDIRLYAQMAGGSMTNSYTVLMLESIGEYHDENNKPNPNQQLLREIKETIQFTVDSELRNLARLQAGAQEALQGLGAFQSVCEDHSMSLVTNANALEAQLVAEGNDMENMKRKMEEAQNEIKEIQKQIDARNRIIANAPKYMWVTIIGMSIGAARIRQSRQAIAEMKIAMQKVEDLLKEYEARMKTASRLQTNIGFISGQVNDLNNEIGPAITTLQLLQGSWRLMETDLRGIKHLVETNAERIPPMRIARFEMEGIVDSWNELRDYSTAYIENSYLSDIPRTLTIADYIAELDIDDPE